MPKKRALWSVEWMFHLPPEVRERLRALYPTPESYTATPTASEDEWRCNDCGNINSSTHPSTDARGYVICASCGLLRGDRKPLATAN